ncbi:hypothetical protein PanWU01x14_093030 [Parasponia andersonii]|uniref:Uncharacterized protein n=1 Tax=Parasponia andersonii TaxID=3476 RepID=A0A2P5D611_PARAD|nr:hypothetical protein PanWU01x14_093030 [Parasponia andersonii]
MVLWEELDLHQNFEIGDPEIASKLAEILERDRVFEFLAGLNAEFDGVSGRILGKEPLCSLEESFSYVNSEEDRKAVMAKAFAPEASALKAEGLTPSFAGQ